MPIPAGSMKTRCQSCGWSTVTRQRSDVLFLPSQCERCGSEQLIHEEQTPDRFNPLSTILDKLKI